VSIGEGGAGFFDVVAVSGRDRLGTGSEAGFTCVLRLSACACPARGDSVGLWGSGVLWGAKPIEFALITDPAPRKTDGDNGCLVRRVGCWGDVGACWTWCLLWRDGTLPAAC